MASLIESGISPTRHLRRYAVAVAIPACNEAESIQCCLDALAAAASEAEADVTVVLMVNNSDDDTAAIARAFRSPSMQVVVEERVLPPKLAHAGGARRAALDTAAALLPLDGVLMTTDADSMVDRYWISANLAEIEAGADAVAGVITFDAAERRRLPALPGRDLEWRLANLQARLAWLLDPQPHDPWPNHIWTWGASIALTVSAYRRVGGLPPIPLAEDRALAAAIERHGLRLRRSHVPVVYTSVRQHGRAAGGFADLIASYAADANSQCDAALEPVVTLVRRLRARARVRRAMSAPDFGRVWAKFEAQDPTLQRCRVMPAALATEVELAERIIRQLEEDRADTPVSAPA